MTDSKNNSTCILQQVTRSDLPTESMSTLVSSCPFVRKHERFAYNQSRKKTTKKKMERDTVSNASLTNGN